MQTLVNCKMSVYKTLATLLLFVFIQTKESSQAQTQRQVASVNATTGHVGKALTLRCEAPDFKIEDKRLEVYFHLGIVGNVFIAYYVLQNPSANQTKATFNLPPKPKTEFISLPSSRPNTLTVFEISIVPKAQFKSFFFCNVFYNGSLISRKTNNVTIDVDLALPSFTTQVSHVHLNQPTTVSCSLEKFKNLQNKRYFVKFFNLRDGLLATYDVNGTGKAFLYTKEYKRVATHLGARSSFPNFDLIITEKANFNQSYWCSLLDSSNQTWESPHWTSVPPFVDFTSTFCSSSKEEQATCFVDQFTSHSTVEYRVNFYSDLGLKKEENQLFAYYIIRPNNTTTELVIEEQSFWYDTIHGDTFSYPNFEIVSKVNSTIVSKSSKSWWCALVISQPGQSNYRQIKSNSHSL